VFIFSCHHDKPDPGTTDNGPTDTTAISKNLLAQTVLTTATGATTMTYRYDAQNRLAWYSNTSTEPGYFEDTSSIVRDAQGVITKIVYSSDTSSRYPDPKVDTIVYNVTYDAAASQYLYKVARYKMFSTAGRDSVAYTYNTQNRITQENAYYYNKGYIKWATYDYTYNDSSDLINWKTTYYDIDSNHTNYTFENAYTYDDKGVNLLNLGNDAIVVGLPQHSSGHLPKTQVGTYPANPEYNVSFTYNYTYNTKYRPLKADITDAANGNAKSTMIFTYQ
jgi:hypothetical protein